MDFEQVPGDEGIAGVQGLALGFDETHPKEDGMRAVIRTIGIALLLCLVLPAWIPEGRGLRSGTDRNRVKQVLPRLPWT